MRHDTWREHPDARAELLAESDHLPEDIAERLILDAEAAADDVIDAPQSWPKVQYWDEPPTLRRRKIGRFRIDVIYYVASGEIRVIAYAHERRMPGYFAQRMESFR